MVVEQRWVVRKVVYVEEKYRMPFDNIGDGDGSLRSGYKTRSEEIRRHALIRTSRQRLLGGLCITSATATP